MSDRAQVSKVNICIKILKGGGQSVTDSPRVGIELPGQTKT